MITARAKKIKNIEACNVVLPSGLMVVVQIISLYFKALRLKEMLSNSIVIKHGRGIKKVDGEICDCKTSLFLLGKLKQPDYSLIKPMKA